MHKLRRQNTGTGMYRTHNHNTIIIYYSLNFLRRHVDWASNGLCNIRLVQWVVISFGENTFHYIEDTLSFLWSFMFLYGIPGRENKRDGLGTNWKKCIIAFYFFPVWGVCDDEWKKKKHSSCQCERSQSPKHTDIGNFGIKLAHRWLN